MAFLLAAGLLVLEKSDRLVSKGKAKAPGTLLGWHKRAVPLTLPAAPEAGGDARANARERAARAAVEAAQHTVWTPAREGALLAALAATPEYAAGQRLPNEARDRARCTRGAQLGARRPDCRQNLLEQAPAETPVRRPATAEHARHLSREPP